MWLKQETHRIIKVEAFHVRKTITIDNDFSLQYLFCVMQTMANAWWWKWKFSALFYLGKNMLEKMR